MSTERRLVFGETADLYHRYRPSYPTALIDDLVALARLDGSRPVLEIGAGTGKATALFAARGIPVVAVEPSAEMASHLRAHPSTSVEIADFEDWEPAGRRFQLVYSAQAWHWIRPEAGYEKVAEALEPGGWLAAFWNRPDWARCSLRERLIAVYEAAAPDAERDGPMHPTSSFHGLDEDWDAEVARAAGLDGGEVREYAWSLEYSAVEYAGLLATTSELQLMEPTRRDALLAAISAAIGERISLPMSTRLCLARRDRGLPPGGWHGPEASTPSLGR